MPKYVLKATDDAGNPSWASGDVHMQIQPKHTCTQHTIHWPKGQFLGAPLTHICAQHGCLCLPYDSIKSSTVLDTTQTRETAIMLRQVISWHVFWCSIATCPAGQAINMKTNINSTESHTCKAMISLKVAHVASVQTASMRMSCKHAEAACSLTKPWQDCKVMPRQPLGYAVYNTTITTKNNQ